MIADRLESAPWMETSWPPTPFALRALEFKSVNAQRRPVGENANSEGEVVAVGSPSATRFMPPVSSTPATSRTPRDSPPDHTAMAPPFPAVSVAKGEAKATASTRVFKQHPGGNRGLLLLQIHFPITDQPSRTTPKP